ncbi:hypothetical protein, partial [Sinorhizobium sp. NFACC03]|uniref:hypothetical protein n=1 Tax=Sinorhizobium sp. NFACC03 TaxID=1566295 RepID=UPI001AEC801E
KPKSSHHTLRPCRTRAATKRPFCFARIETNNGILLTQNPDRIKRDFAFGKTRKERINPIGIYRDDG